VIELLCGEAVLLSSRGNSKDLVPCKYSQENTEKLRCMTDVQKQLIPEGIYSKNVSLG